MVQQRSRQLKSNQPQRVGVVLTRRLTVEYKPGLDEFIRCHFNPQPRLCQNQLTAFPLQQQ